MRKSDGPEPWVGSRYKEEGLGTRLLIVGESHYGEETQVADAMITQRVLSDRSDNLAHQPFFGVVEQIVLGRKPLIFEVKRFWERVAFINYAPVLVTDGISSREEHFVGAQTRMKRVVEELEPDLVCFFSAKAWTKRPWGGPDWTKEAFGSEPRHISDSSTLYPFKDRAIIMGRFNHPRQLGAPMDVWHVWYRRLAEIAADVATGAII